jgi:EAL domain-containing protein (putative c-di-GMP-specific phosphodiesterase class I)
VVLVAGDLYSRKALLGSLIDERPVVAYESARDALDHVMAGRVSVLVSDVDLPDMTGLELLRTVRRQDPDLPVVLMTGSTTELATLANRHEIFRCLRKPVGSTDLRATVEQASRLYRLARMKREALELVGAAGASGRFGLEAAFRRALASVSMAFQPIVSMSRGSVYGYEALMRSAEAALASPLQLLQAAEHLGALEELGRRVRRSAVEPMRDTRTDLLLFVNIHPLDLMDAELCDPDSPLAAMAGRVVLEITERCSLNEVEDIQARVSAARALGFRIAIDDLGAGYAGLTSFVQLEPDIVKIDATLTRGIDRSPLKQGLVRSLAGLSKEMGMTIITEGVETVEERDMLVTLGCDLLQGHLFAQPGPPFPAVRW